MKGARPEGSGSLNTFNVLYFGVAVNAKKLMCFCQQFPSFHGRLLPFGPGLRHLSLHHALH